MDRNYAANAVDQILPGSLSARRAWIEIKSLFTSVVSSTVALRKESVDRNLPLVLIFLKIGVALRKESVDRNSALAPKQNTAEQSLSARRAWIEIPWRQGCPPSQSVALRKESVDRNAKSIFAILTL